MGELNKFLFPGAELALQEELLQRLKLLFPNDVPTLIAVIADECSKELDTDRYISTAQDGNMSFCDECIEPTCCTKSDPIALTDDDIKKIKEKGYKNFIKTYVPPKDSGITGGSAIRKTKPCMFLISGRCAIYDVRPYTCWRFPMNVDVKTREPFLIIAASCSVGFNILKHQCIDAMNCHLGR